VYIAVAGLSAALPGAIAARTLKPVIGVPREVRLQGMDALLAIVQMPPGVPVACVGIENWKNAALLALEILALTDAEVAATLAAYRGL
jgi:5-(carboxyamino)imidazole ribonucleotide mutase